MNLIQIGQLIKEQRKSKKLTQFQLAQQLEVSEKTISKWECGNGFPDATLILPLCNALGITANELLSGQKLNDQEYKQHAEQNIVKLQQQDDYKNKLLLRLEWVLGYICSLTFLALIFIASFVDLPIWLRIVTIVFAFIEFLVGISFGLRIEKDAGYYECTHCHHKYIPTYNQVLWAMHIGRTRYMKCPKCNKHSWQKKTLEK